jgi:hypothetical protein
LGIEPGQQLADLGDLFAGGGFTGGGELPLIAVGVLG